MKSYIESKVKIVLPAYNEAESIKLVIDDIQSQFKKTEFGKIECIVVNDGSTDNTEAIVNSLTKKGDVILLNHKINKGLGAALKTGLYYAIQSSQPDDIILTTESDGTQPVDKLIELAKIIHEGSDLSVATPLTRSDFEGVPLHRRVLSHGANLIYKTLFPIDGFHGYTNLLRGFSASILQNALEHYGPDYFMNKAGFEAVPDIILKLRPLKPKITEIRIQINHQKMKRPSTIPIFKTIKNSLFLCAEHFIKNNNSKKLK